MINYATILSDFDDRGTLLKWLKKVEEALQAAGLDDVTVNVVDSTHITLSFDFADGSSVTSGTIELPQGPQGAPGTPGTNGTNGVSVVSASVSKDEPVPGTVILTFSFGLSDGTTAETLPVVIQSYSTGEATVNLVNSSYTNVATATCRWLKLGDTATVTVDVLNFSSSAFYAVELPAAVQGFANTKQRGLFIGATTGTAKYNLCETDTAAPDTGKYIHFIDSMGMNYTMPSATMGTLNITLHY